MKKLAFKFLLILAGVVCIDILVGLLGNWLIRIGSSKNIVGQTSLLNYSLNGVDADVVILGSSEASSAYVPSIISDRLKKTIGKKYSVFNAGTYYQGIAFCYCVERGILDRKLPKLIVLDLVYDYLVPKDYSSITPQLRPYSQINPYVKELLAYNDGEKERILSNSSIYRLNSEIIKIASSLFEDNFTDGFDAHIGALPDGEIKGDMPTMDNSLSDTAKYELDNFFKLAKEKGIPVICTISPKYYLMPEDSEPFKELLNICDDNNVKVLKIYKEAEFDNPQLFHDKGHVNPQGATICTELLANEIEKYISQ